MDAQNRYRRQFILWMGLYVFMYFPMMVLMALVELFPPWDFLRGFWILLTLAPMYMAIRTFVHSFETLDELQKRLHLEAFAFSLGWTCLLTFSYGMLEMFIDQPPLSMIFVMPVAIFLWLAGLQLARRRYE